MTMMKGLTARALTLACVVLSFTTAVAQIPRDYYASVNGKKGADLKIALHEIIREANVLEYGSGAAKTWWGFYVTDNNNGHVIDRYSNEDRMFGSRGKSVGGMNIEHSFPKSWWGGATTQAYCDLFNLMPSDSRANSAKLNYGMGVVAKDVSYENGSIVVGTSSGGFKVWEPDDKWKGDFARDYMYMVTAYQDYVWTNKEAKYSLTTSAWPTFRPWAYNLYIEWALDDAVDKTEIDRNNAVCEIQGNRNPYIDFPNLMQYVWGDSIDYEFNIDKTLRSGEWVSGGLVAEKKLYTSNYHSYDGGCVSVSQLQPKEGVDVWTRNNRYGWVATGAIKTNTSDKYPTKYASEGTLTTPEIDLAGMSSARMYFSHVARYCKPFDDYLTVKVLCDGVETRVKGFEWSTGDDWTNVNSGDISLDEFVGKKIKIEFGYRGTTSTAGTWQIESLTVVGTKVPTAIDKVAVTKGFDPSRPYTIYSTDGRQLPASDRSRGIVIVRQDGRSYKIAR